MQERLLKKLHEYIAENNPELLLELEEESKVIEYLQRKVNSIEHLLQQYRGQPEYIIEEICLDLLTKELRPSKFNYLRSILEEEFEACFKKFSEAGTLQGEIINLLDHCQPVFKVIHFTEENKDRRELRYVIMWMIREYEKCE